MSEQMNVKGLKELEGKLTPQMVVRPTVNLFNRWSILVQNKAKSGAPNNKGQLVGSIDREMESHSLDTPPRWVRVGTNEDHAIFMEGGTGLLNDLPEFGGNRKRHFPPPEKLDDWAHKHGIASGLIVARAIWRRGGLKPRRFLRNAFDEGEENLPGLLNHYAREIEEEAALG